MYLFESLEAYTNAVRFAVVMEMSTKEFPKSTYYFADKLVSSAKSIYQNLAEAHSTWKDVDKKAGFWKSRDQIEECFNLLDVASRQNVLSPTLRDNLRSHLADLRAQVQSLIRGPAKWAKESVAQAEEMSLGASVARKNLPVL